MAMQTTSDNAEGEPMMDINTTPLIDVMLVLLIMFIITIPIQSHAVKLDLPVNLEQLRQYLDISQQMNPVPELHLQPEPEAPYGAVDEVLAVTKRAHVEKMGFVGNEAYMDAF